MRRLILALILIASASAAVPQPVGRADLALMQRRTEEAEHRAQAAERAAQIREAADRLEDAQTQQAYDRFEIWTGLLIGFFSVLITILVVIFGFRTVRVAAIEASAAAQREVTDRIGAIEALSEKAKAATARAEASAQEADQEVKKVRAGAKALTQAAKRTRAEPSEPGGPQVNLTVAEAAAVKAGAEASPEKPAADLSVDEFRVQIAKAAYIDEDYETALRLAIFMEVYHSADDRALSFALRQQGDALQELGHFERGFGAYSDLIRRFSASADPEIAFDVLWARYHRGILFGELGRDAEAEEEFQILIPIVEQQFGPEGTNTLNARHAYVGAVLDLGRAEEAEGMLRDLLSTRARVEGAEHSRVLGVRHDLARAVLYQGKAEEAVAELRELLPLVERVDGKEKTGTYVTRYLLADALLQAGHAEEAESTIETIPEVPANVDWMPRHAAARAFIRGRIADALGRRGEATGWLNEARSGFAAIFPTHHLERKRVDDYLASRG